MKSELVVAGVLLAGGGLVAAAQGAFTGGAGTRIESVAGSPTERVLMVSFMTGISPGCWEFEDIDVQESAAEIRLRVNTVMKDVPAAGKACPAAGQLVVREVELKALLGGRVVVDTSRDGAGSHVPVEPSTKVMPRIGPVRAMTGADCPGGRLNLGAPPLYDASVSTETPETILTRLDRWLGAARPSGRPQLELFKPTPTTWFAQWTVGGAVTSQVRIDKTGAGWQIAETRQC